MATVTITPISVKPDIFRDRTGMMRPMGISFRTTGCYDALLLWRNAA